jgi:hypothetical protein
MSILSRAEAHRYPRLGTCLVAFELPADSEGKGLGK